MFHIIIYNLIFATLGSADTFSTSIGDCTLDIFEGRVKDIPEIVHLVKEETTRLITEFGNIKPKPFSIYITNNMQDFFERTKGPVPEWGIAVAKKNPDRIILKSPGIANITFARMKEVIIHEINHIYLYRIPQNFSMPSWFKEGMAMHSSREFSLTHKIQISKSIWQNQVLPLARLQNFSTYSEGRVKLAYGESAAALEALEYYYGENILNKILNNMRKEINFKKALESATKEELIDFEVKFETYLKNNYNWIFLLMSPKYIYVFLPIILVLGFIYHHFRSNKILKQWEIEEKLDNSERGNELHN